MQRLILVIPLLFACSGPAGPMPGDDTFIRLVAVRDSFNDTYLLHWSEREMPLRVYLPRPPEGLFENTEAVYDSVRDGVLDWSNVAAPGVPSFTFVDRHGDANIPITWASAPDGDWYIAFCSYQVNTRMKRFGVEQILVTGRWGDGHEADLHEIYEVVLHEMGHALGLMGHSDDPLDIMYPSISGRSDAGLSERDRRTLQELYAHGNRQIRGKRGRR
jgi:predicted Zn-dependent protease